MKVIGAILAIGGLIGLFIALIAGCLEISGPTVSIASSTICLITIIIGAELVTQGEENGA